MHSAHAGRVWWIRRPDSGYNAGKRGRERVRRCTPAENPRESRKIDLRKPDQRPMAEERRQHDIRPLGESQHQRDGEDRDRAGHHGRGHHRKSTPQGQREKRINERHTEQRQSKLGVSSRAPERIVSGRQIIDPNTAHDRPEQGQNIVNVRAERNRENNIRPRSRNSMRP